MITNKGVRTTNFSGQTTTWEYNKPKRPRIKAKPVYKYVKVGSSKD